MTDKLEFKGILNPGIPTNAATTKSRNNHKSKFDFSPQPDITAYELALCLRVILSIFPGSTRDTLQELEALSPAARRHFTELSQ